MIAIKYNGGSSQRTSLGNFTNLIENEAVFKKIFSTDGEYNIFNQDFTLENENEIKNKLKGFVYCLGTLKENNDLADSDIYIPNSTTEQNAYIIDIFFDSDYLQNLGPKEKTGKLEELLNGNKLSILNENKINIIFQNDKIKIANKLFDFAISTLKTEVEKHLSKPEHKDLKDKTLAKIEEMKKIKENLISKTLLEKEQLLKEDPNKQKAENILKELELTNLVNYKIIDNNQKPLIEECNAKIEDIQELFVSSPETVFYFIDKPVMKTLVEYSQSYNFKNFFLHNPSLVLENLDKEAVKDFYQKNPNEINQVLTKAIESTITNEQQFDNLKSLQTFLTEFNIIGNQEQKNELANKINSQSALTNLININASFPGQTLGKGL